MAPTQWPTPSPMVTTSYSFAGTPDSEHKHNRVDASTSELSSNAVESSDSMLGVNPMSSKTGHSHDPNEQMLSSVSVRDKAQPMSSLSCANSGIRFQLTPKQSPNVSKPVNKAFVSKPQTNKESEVRQSQTDQHNSIRDQPVDNERKNSTKEATPDQWPESLRDYVNRAFSACVNELDKDRIEIILKGKLTKAHHEGVLFTKDWTKEPLPGLASPKNTNNNSSKQNSLSIAMNGNRNSRIKDLNRKTRKRSKSRSRSPSSSRSDSSGTVDRFKDRKYKQAKLEKYVLLVIIIIVKTYSF